MSRQKELEEKYGKILFEDALSNLLGDNAPIAELTDIFEYYGVERLGKGFDKLEPASQMYIVGGIVHRFTAGLPDGAGLAEITMENSEWDCFLIKKGAGYEPEVELLRKASDE